MNEVPFTCCTNMLSIMVFFVCLIMVTGHNPQVCPVCDQNDYKPVCAEGKAYSSLCKLKREICLGKIVLVEWKYGTCTVLREPTQVDKMDDHDSRVVFRLFSLRK